MNVKCKQLTRYQGFQLVLRNFNSFYKKNLFTRKFYIYVVHEKLLNEKPIVLDGPNSWFISLAAGSSGIRLEDFKRTNLLLLWRTEIRFLTKNFFFPLSIKRVKEGGVGRSTV